MCTNFPSKMPKEKEKKERGGGDGGGKSRRERKRKRRRREEGGRERGGGVVIPGSIQKKNKSNQDHSKYLQMRTTWLSTSREVNQEKQKMTIDMSLEPFSREFIITSDSGVRKTPGFPCFPLVLYQ